MVIGKYVCVFLNDHYKVCMLLSNESAVCVCVWGGGGSK